MRYRSFITALACLLALPVFLLCMHAFLPACYGETYYAELSEMKERLKTAEKPKIAVIGNSDVAFGLQVDRLETLLNEKGFNYTVCPFGLYAALGTDAMLELSEPCLSEGDIVVLVVEPVSETLTTYFGADVFLKCAEKDPLLFLDLSSSQKKAVLGNFPEVLSARLKIVKSGEFPSTGDVYSRSSFDENCSLIYERAGNAMRLGYDTLTPVDLADVYIDEKYAENIRKYVISAEKKGARVCISFSPVNKIAIKDQSDEAVNAYFKTVYNAFPCTVISDPNDYILDSGWFYDSNFHLNSDGAILRTEQLAEDLLSFLGCYSAVERTPLTMPDSIWEQSVSAGDEQAFRYILSDDRTSFLVSGLTEEGAMSDSLTVPSLHEGLPVTGFTEDAFKYAENLTELVLPDSIEALPDNAFSGAKRLERLILMHLKKPPVPTESTFSGSSLRIFVPKSAYSLYRDGAGCETNVWEKYIDMIVAY